MELLTDVGCGDWLLARVGDGARVGGVAGVGFEAYARILHPVPAHRVDLEVADEWGMHPLLEETRWPWSRVAQRQGLTMHPLVQWNRLADIHQGVDFDDGWRVGQTREGFFDLDLLAALTEPLGAATGTPDQVVAAIWNGSYANRKGPFLEWPDREFVLFATSTVELADPTWPERSGVGVQSGSSDISPQLLWPADRSWIVASEIDWDSTIVAGSRSLVDAVLANEQFEAFEVGEDDDLTYEGDTINPPRAD